MAYVAGMVIIIGVGLFVLYKIAGSVLARTTGQSPGLETDLASTGPLPGQPSEPKEPACAIPTGVTNSSFETGC
jgi:hypothetical protein